MRERFKPVVLDQEEVAHAFGHKVGTLARPFARGGPREGREPGEWMILCSNSRRMSWWTNKRHEVVRKIKTGELVSDREYLVPFEEWIHEHAPWKKGDVLWGRETWAGRKDVDGAEEPGKARHYCLYKERGDERPPGDHWHSYGNGWRPATQMPDWAARVFLEVTSVKYRRPEESTDKYKRWEWVARWRRLDADKFRERQDRTEVDRRDRRAEADEANLMDAYGVNHPKD